MGYTPTDVSVVKGGKLKTTRIVWAAVSTLVARYDADPEGTLAWMNSFNVLAKDECHEHSAREDEIMRSVTIWARLGMSATPMTSVATRDANTIGTYGPILYTLRNIDLHQRGVIKAPHVYVLEVQHERQTFSCYRQFHSYITKHIDRNQLIVRVAGHLLSLGHHVVVSTESVNPHATTLVGMLSEIGPAEIFDSSLSTADQRTAALQRLSTGEISFLVASRVFEVGVSNNCISAIVLGGLIGKEKSGITVPQITGRGLRLGESSARHVIIVDLQDRTQYGTGQGRRRMEVWRDDAAIDLQVFDDEHTMVQKLRSDHMLWSRSEVDLGSERASTAFPSDPALWRTPDH
jgi:superfamily II DNA or RNA helicase